MFGVFVDYLHSKGTFTAADIAAIRSRAMVRQLRRRQLLLRQGESWKHYAFVCEGCLKSYFVDDKGVERIMRFSPEHWWAGDRQSITSGQPSVLNIEALEDSTLVMFTLDDFNYLLEALPEMKKMAETLLNRSLMAATNRIQAAISLSGEERYQQFAQLYPGLIKRVPQHMIASYLGITPETLSRIRASLARRKS
ncbi:Crp/Fnr family transcriptional regulator [Chitinophaga sp. 22536]|uniref:Crp/Fnr family transcriptional regulator n=1 Tax=unclassified Chitinophaga TaxID=2619133 RepID=UPI003F87D04D